MELGEGKAEKEKSEPATSGDDIMGDIMGSTLDSLGIQSQ